VITCDLQRQLAVGSGSRQEVAVLITTESRAYAGWIDLRLLDGPGQCVYQVRALKNAIRWTGTTMGVAELAAHGPKPEAKLEMASDSICVTNVRGIRPLTREAIAAWGI